VAGKITPLDTVLSRLTKLDIYADEHFEYPGEWYQLWNSSEDAALYRSLLGRWPSIVTPFWNQFALVYCPNGYADSGDDAGVWLHYLGSPSGRIKSEFASGTHSISVW
jgi:hypothetical protein